MKKLSLIILLLIALALFPACATATPATPTILAETSLTSTPTLIPPTVTIEPSPTVDPNMPAGATGKDANGNWTKTENGLTVTWNKDLNTWERLITNGNGVSLLVFNTVVHGSGVSDNLFLHAFVDHKFPGFDKIASLSLVSGAGESNGPSFANVFRRAFRIKFGVTDWNKLPNLSFATSEGSQVWDGTSVEVHLLKNMPEGYKFDTWKDPYGFTIQTCVFTKGGKLFVWHVPSVSIETLTTEQMMELYLYGPANIIDGSSVGSVGYSSELSTLVATATNKSLPPFFNFGPPQ